MNITQYKSSVFLNFDGNIDDKEDIIDIIICELHNQKLFTERDKDRIQFKRRIQFTTHTGKNKFEILKPIKGGNVDIKIDSKSKLIIDYYIDLKFHTTICFFLFVAVVLLCFSESNGAISLKMLLTSLIFAVGLYCYYLWRNKKELDKIICLTKERIKNYKQTGCNNLS